MSITSRGKSAFTTSEKSEKNPSLKARSTRIQLVGKIEQRSGLAWINPSKNPSKRKEGRGKEVKRKEKKKRENKTKRKGPRVRKGKESSLQTGCLAPIVLSYGRSLGWETIELFIGQSGARRIAPGHMFYRPATRIRVTSPFEPDNPYRKPPHQLLSVGRSVALLIERLYFPNNFSVLHLFKKRGRI
ncbi:hypothetical protein NPIL_652601 [Nephila pilipes]|uniref:Uncharacterized protein n=1 Tax=Nephila pilipes TaxID=299642 RepID=A0A8X6MW60_NEPPI|nr:hypothetical protein NPIL_652601 [Nephila pilipes]